MFLVLISTRLSRLIKSLKDGIVGSCAIFSGVRGNQIDGLCIQTKKVGLSKNPHGRFTSYQIYDRRHGVGRALRFDSCGPEALAANKAGRPWRMAAMPSP
jgi:hypothetical protein